MPTYKLAVTKTWLCIEFLQSRYQDVDPAVHLGLDRALSLAGGDPQEWVNRILDTAANAPDTEIPGLVEALQALLSMEERPAAELIDERRGG
ncbi:MAG TPA: hypothetical protein VGL57_13520 [Solirubrobacteraceae bacterium]|jgi:hypothetical protein